MDTLFYFNAAIAICLALGCAYVIYLVITHRSQITRNIGIADELYKLILKARESAKINQDMAALYNIDFEQNGYLGSPAMLSSIITVIIAKYGDLKLSLDDFKKVKDSDYVSVYVDIKTKELVLSTDHDLSSYQDSFDMIDFANRTPDDSDTYH